MSEADNSSLLGTTLQNSRDIKGLQVGMESLGHRVDTGLSGLHKDISAYYQANDSQNKNRPSWVSISVLAMGVMVAAGSILGFGFSLITTGIERETDMRFELVSRSLEIMRDQLKVDDMLQLEYARQHGIDYQKAIELERRVTHADELQHVADAETDRWREVSTREAARTQSVYRAIGDYLKEHTGKPAGAGHPTN